MGTGTVVCRLRVAQMTAIFSAALLPLAAYAAQSTRSASQSPAVMSTAEKLAEIETEVTRLRNEFGLREEVARLRKESEHLREQLESRSTPRTLWTEVAPWAALALVGVGFAIAWALSAWKKPAEAITPTDLTSRLEPLIRDVGNVDAKISAVEKQFGELSSTMAALEGRFNDVSTNITELWKLLATGGATGRRDT